RNNEGRFRPIWWASFMSGGKQIQISTGVTNKRTAEKFLAIKKAEVAEGRLRLIASRPPQFGEYADGFLNSVQHLNTRKRYRSSIRNLFPYFKPTRLSE